TGRQQTTTTDRNGRYIFSGLETGTYEITAGDTKQTVQLFLGHSVIQPLKVSTAAALTVQKQTPLPVNQHRFSPLEINQGRTGMTLTESELKESPGRGLDGPRLLLQAPGASVSADGGVNFNAIPEEQTVFRVNGVDTAPLVFIPSSSFQENRSFALG